jgi:copper oxidase (laccase) domain-containing protein
MFNRHGGVSGGPYASLNIGRNLGDLPELVAENRRLVKETLKIPRLLSAHQVHGPRVYCLTEPITEDTSIDAVDALVTDQPDVGLMIQQADCRSGRRSALSTAVGGGAFRGFWARPSKS